MLRVSKQQEHNDTTFAETTYSRVVVTSFSLEARPFLNQPSFLCFAPCNDTNGSSLAEEHLMRLDWEAETSKKSIQDVVIVSLTHIIINTTYDAPYSPQLLLHQTAAESAISRET